MDAQPTHPPSAAPPQPAADRLDPDAAAAVLARAAALQLTAGTAQAGEGLDDAAVLAVGREVGLGEDAVLRALAEHRAAQAVTAPEQPGRGSWLGPAVVRRSRVLTEPATTVTARLDGLLRRAVLDRRRDLGGSSVWSPSPGMVAGLRRRVTPPGALAWLTRLEVAVVALDRDRCQVLLVARCDGRRRGHARGAVTSAGLVVLGVGTTVAGLLADPTLALALPAGAAGVGGLGVVASRGSWHRVTDELGLSLDGLIDDAARTLPEADRAAGLGPALLLSRLPRPAALRRRR